ncbi:MAG: hypothetical protein ABIR59_00810 [Gemmatimonadales bacterium]
MEGRAQTMGDFMPLFRVATDTAPRPADPLGAAAASGGDRRRDVVTVDNQGGAQ